MFADSNRPNSNSGLKIIRLSQKGVTYRHKERDVREDMGHNLCMGVTFEADSTITVCVMECRGRKRRRRRRKKRKKKKKKKKKKKEEEE